jgi:hypothetical protein
MDIGSFFHEFNLDRWLLFGQTCNAGSPFSFLFVFLAKSYMYLNYWRFKIQHKIVKVVIGIPVSVP